MTRLARWFTSAILGLGIGLLIGSYAFAQATPAPALLTCEQQLAQLQKAALQLRKDNAQEQYRAASLEEMVLKLQEDAKATKGAASVAPAPGEPKK